MTVKRFLVYIALLLGIGTLAAYFAAGQTSANQTPAVIPAPTTLQTIQFVCAAPVGGTVIPPGLPIDGIMLICVQRVVNIPIVPPCNGSVLVIPCIGAVVPVAHWTIVANEGDKVLIKAGTQVRYGAPAGTPPGDSYVTVPLAADSYANSIVVAADSTLTVGTSAFGGVDPAPNYVKHLEILDGTGSVVVNPQ